jgi:hypothetical protein
VRLLSHTSTVAETNTLFVGSVAKHVMSKLLSMKPNKMTSEGIAGGYVNAKPLLMFHDARHATIAKTVAKERKTIVLIVPMTLRQRTVK